MIRSRVATKAARLSVLVNTKGVAKELLSGASVPVGKLIIGGNGSLRQESLWSGLIDDIRIYNRAVRPWSSVAA